MLTTCRGNRIHLGMIVAVSGFDRGFGMTGPNFSVHFSNGVQPLHVCGTHAEREQVEDAWLSLLKDWQAYVDCKAAA